MVPFPEVSLLYPTFTLQQPPIQKWSAMVGFATPALLRERERRQLFMENLLCDKRVNNLHTTLPHLGHSCAISLAIILILQMKNR